MTTKPSNRQYFLSVFGRSWRTVLGFVAPIALLPFLLDYQDKASLCAYVLILMVIYWMFEPINLYVTALIPVALFPLLGIATTDEVCINYMKGTNMMFFGGLIMGIALEHSNLHRRVALKVIIFFGSSVKNLMAGIMLVTMFLSMWINNTATTAMMIPIVDSILVEIYDAKDESSNGDIGLSVLPSSEDEQESRAKIGHRNGHINGKAVVVAVTETEATEMSLTSQKHNLKILRKALLLSIAYSANIGGTATLTGTGTNLVLQEVFMSKFPKSHDLTFTSWFIYAFPAALVTIFAAWALLYVFFVRVHKESPETGARIKSSARQKYEELGPFTFHEVGVLIHFVLLVLLWFFRQPGLYPGWADMLTDNKVQIKDATPAILIAISMFLIPANFRQYVSAERPKEIKRLLNWRVLQDNMSWGVVFLLGGGFALAFGTERSGLTSLFSNELKKVDMQPVLATFVLVFIGATVTEMASNVATANVILPVICQLAVHMQVNPLMFVVPVTIGISFAFMFPVSTPPNAIVFEYLKMSVIEMVKPGICMNLIAIAIQLAFINSLGRLVFDLSEFPDWARDDNSTSPLQNRMF